MAELKLVLCGDKWPAQEKLSNNLILKIPAEKPLEDSSVGIRRLLKEDSLSKYDFHKGKGKPPNVIPGAKVSLQKTPKEIGDKGGLVVLYIKEKEDKKKDKSDTVKLLLCGEEWKSMTKLSDNILVQCKRSEKLETVLPLILRELKLSSFDDYEMCKGRGKAPDVTPGAVVQLSRTPDSLGLSGAALLYVRKVKVEVKEEKKEEKVQEHRTIYQLGARVDVLDPDNGEWLPGSVTCVREDGTYDVTYDKGSSDKYVESDDLRPGKELPKTEAAPKKVSVDDQRKALKALLDEFPNKSVPEVGGVLKSKGFDVEEARRLLKATEPEEEEKPEKKKVIKPIVLEKYTINLSSPTESLGLEFHTISNKVFIDLVVEDHPFARAKVPTDCILIKMNNEFVKDKAGILTVLGNIRKDGIMQFDIEVDTRPEAKIWLYAPVDVCFDREWERGIVVALNDDETFDVKMVEDGETEHSVEYQDIRIRTGDIKEANDAAEGLKDAPPTNPPSTMPDHEGIVKKQGADVVGLYKLRRFALYGTALYYFHPNKPKPLGVLDLRQSVVVSDVKKGQDWFAIGGKRLDRVYNFIAGSTEEKDDWLVAFQEAGSIIKRKNEE